MLEQAVGEDALALGFLLRGAHLVRHFVVHCRVAFLVPCADRDQMLQMWDTYNKTNDATQKGDAEKKLATRVDEIAKATVDASRKTFAVELENVKKILTPDQLTKMAQH